MIKVELATSSGILSVPDDFDELVTHGGMSLAQFDQSGGRSELASAGRRSTGKQSVASVGRTVYRLSFAADLARALARNAMTVEIEAFAIEQPAKASAQVFSIVEQVLMSANNAKGKANDVQLKLIAAIDVDLTSRVSNDKASSIALRQPVDVMSRTKRIVARSNKELSDARIDAPIIESSTLDDAHSQQSNMTLRGSAYEMLARGIDPSSVASFTARIDSARSLAGTSLDGGMIVPRAADDITRSRFFAFIGGRLLSGISTADYSADATLPVAMIDVNERTPIDVELAFPPELLSNRCLLRFTLVDALGIAVDAVSREIDHAENVRLFDTPLHAPIIDASRPRTGLGTARVTMRQVDSRAVAIELYRKVVPLVGRSDQASYAKLATVEASLTGPSAVVDVPIDATGPMVFRCIAVGALGARSHSFSSVVLKPHAVAAQLQALRHRELSLIARITALGVAVEVRSIPHGAVGIDVFRRDATLPASKASNVSRAGTVIVDENSMQPVVFVDESVKPNHVYEYSCKLLDRYGSRYDAAARATIEYVALVENLVDTRLINQLVTVIDEDDIDFTFDIVSNVVDTNLQSIKNLLDASAMFELFGDEVKDDRALLNMLLAHQVVRRNLTTGDAESFGVVTGEAFSDRALRGINAVRPLARRNTYRYDVHALLRSPDTLIESLIARSILSGKQHQFKPAKFMHPLAAAQGSITTPETRKRNHARDELSFGRVGTVASVDVSLAGEVPSVIELDVARLASRRIVLRWRVTSSNDMYDHFVVMKELVGIRSFVGAVHNVSDASTHEMLLDLHDSDVGAIRFVVFPVFNDYTVGQEVMSPEIVVS